MVRRRVVIDCLLPLLPSLPLHIQSVKIQDEGYEGSVEAVTRNDYETKWNEEKTQN
jgi:hypothetical protein